MVDRTRPVTNYTPLSGISGLSFDSLLMFPFLFSCLVLLLFLSCQLMVHFLWLFLPENCAVFFIVAFLYGCYAWLAAMWQYSSLRV